MTPINKRILVTGGAGFLGSHIVDKLHERGYADVAVIHSSEFDLRIPESVNRMYRVFEPKVVIHAAARCGGIGLNKAKPAELFHDNMMMGLLMMEGARQNGVKKFVQIGTVCEYPKYAKLPFMESEIWDGYPEETNAPYGIAKKALLVQGQAYRQQYGLNVIHLLPVNLYGPRDNFNPESSHVIPALIKKIADAKEANEPTVSIWGSGFATREFLYVEDAAEAIVRATELYNSPEPVNIGTGYDVTIADLAERIAFEIQYNGIFIYDTSMPDGQPRRVLSIKKAINEFGFRATTKLQEGLDRTIKWYYNERNHGN